MVKMHLSRVVLAAAFAGFASLAGAVPINLTAELTGDPRPGNPDNLNVDVTIVSDTTSNTATFTINLDMAASHPSARLGEFGFNLGLNPGESFAITAITNPAGWSIVTDVNSSDQLQGFGGGTNTFLLTLEDPSGSGNNVTNNDATNLIFTLTKTGGFFTASDFVDASLTCSNDVIGCVQMGAHLQSLVAGPGESDSGIAAGSFDGTLTPAQISEPGILALGGFGLFVLGLMRRRAA
jgi:hypothetical protein